MNISFAVVSVKLNVKASSFPLTYASVDLPMFRSNVSRRSTFSKVGCPVNVTLM